MARSTRADTQPPEPQTETIGARLEGLLREVIDLAKELSAKGERIDNHVATLDDIAKLLILIKEQNEKVEQAKLAETQANRADRAERRDTIMRIVMPISTAIAGAIASLVAAATAYYFGVKPPAPPDPPPAPVPIVVPAPAPVLPGPVLPAPAPKQPVVEDRDVEPTP